MQSSGLTTVAWGTLGLLTMILIVLVTFSLAAAWMGRYGDRPAAAYPLLMVPSLVPIVVGYAIAHYTTLLVVEGQRTAINWSDPLGRGWNVFGSAEMGVNAALFDYPTVIALIQLSPSSPATSWASCAPTSWPYACCRRTGPWSASCPCCWSWSATPAPAWCSLARPQSAIVHAYSVDLHYLRSPPRICTRTYPEPVAEIASRRASCRSAAGSPWRRRGRSAP